MDLEALALANQICNANGLDTISASGTIAFAMECFERDLLTLVDTGGIELRFGDADALVRTLQLIVVREGIGDILAEGSRRAAQQIGRSSERYAVQVKGVEPGYPDARLKPGLGVIYAINPMGADHMVGMHDTNHVASTGMELPSRFGLLDPVPANDLTYQKARLIAIVFPWAQLLDSIELCHFVPWSPDDIVDLVRAATGWRTSTAELHKVGQRTLALGRIFNAR